MRRSESALLYGGIAVAVTGFVLIAVAWGKVAGEESVALQLPYVVSGGLFGLALVIVGATVVNIHAKRVDAADRERQGNQLVEFLRQVAIAVDDTIAKVSHEGTDVVNDPIAGGEGDGTTMVESVDDRDRRRGTRTARDRLLARRP